MTSNRIRGFLHVCAGALVALTSLLVDYIVGKPPDWGLTQSLVLASGLLIMVVGFVPCWGMVSRLSETVCLSLLGLFVSLVLCEILFRAIDFDFAREEQASRKIPPYYRQPTAPTGDVFFRRPGPEQWHGQVLNTVLQKLNALPNPYTAEPAITVTYNKWGFRNPDDMLNWDIAVAGDSFTELGYLPSEQLFTTILGNVLNLKVLNLGTSYTGPLTQLSYLQDYGVSPSTKHAIIVFFEGNDLSDLEMEYQALTRWRMTGQRDYREFKRQPSIAKAIYKFYSRFQYPFKRNDYTSGYLKSRDGIIPISLAYTPPGRAQLSKETLQQLTYFFNQYAAFGKTRRVTIWLAYMPTILRVVYGNVGFYEGASPKQRSWQPTDLPQVISELSDQHGVRFIDLTPALVVESKNRLLHNTVYDTHLNALGSMVVAQEIARHFGRFERANHYRPSLVKLVKTP